ncbi:SAP domain-containing protein [Nocardioides jejuensis]|uniref:Rho termination factor N-terminal domain-containing protein n=1 Tax=Nocardioides jejuensis TaxID=2502782 RepID=A0A4V2NXY4_9ACTN|nr:SAP domain-containing protein [Nocardioides jejuensis]TCJ23022.1 hypothetical protein EPD65_11715 [Nocardioides jejuensis]
MASVQLRNINPIGHVDVPILRRQGPVSDACLADPDGICRCEHGVGCLAPGEVFDCPEEIAGRVPSETDPGEGLLAQVGNYELVDPDNLSALTVAELRDLATERGIDLGDATKKADIVAAIEKGN